MAAIELEDVWKSFRIYQQRSRTLKELLLVRRSEFETFWALKGVTFQVPEGEMLGIVGPNGSGKSTTLKTLARILVPNKGRVVARGKVSAMLELGTGFHPELSGHDNLYLAGSMMGLTTADIDARYASMVEFADIGEFIESPVKNYSSGMYARLAFALAVSVDADILLIDEVLAVGDEAFQLRCHERITEMRRGGVTIVYVTHSLAVVRSLCTRAVWIQDGTVRQDGEAAEVVSTYFEQTHDAHDAEQERWVSPPPGERVGTGEVRVTGLASLNTAGNEHRWFDCGDPCTLRIEYEATGDVEELVCTVEFRRTLDGALITEVTSAASIGPQALPKGGGTITFAIPSLPLLNSGYFLTVGLHDLEKRRVFDWLEQTYEIAVYGEPNDRGAALYLPGEWKVNPGL